MPRGKPYPPEFKAKVSLEAMAGHIIGAAYPNKKRVSIVIWDEDIDGNRQLLDDVFGRSNCWISVTGYLSKYNGNMQMKSSNGLSYTWWTGVN